MKILHRPNATLFPIFGLISLSGKIRIHEKIKNATDLAKYIIPMAKGYFFAWGRT
jgi:hypothetical protein